MIEAMEDICNLQNFGSYEYSPPKTGQACRHLMGRCCVIIFLLLYKCCVMFINVHEVDNRPDEY